ncbi:MAG: flagellar basal body P-ring formation chaperone FlgA [Calditrichia bacterium]
MNRLFKITLIFCLLFAAAAVYGEGQTVFSSQQICGKIQSYVDNCYSQSGARFEIEWIQSVPDVTLLNSPDLISVSHRGEVLPRGNQVVKISFYSRRQILRSIYVPVKIHVFQKVLITNRPISRDERLDPGKMDIEEKDITTLPGEPLQPSAGIQGLICKKRLPGKRVILEKDVRQPYLVHKGENLNISYRKANLHITLQAEAMQNGSQGDLIWVRVPDSRKRLQVKIIGAGLTAIP